VCLEGRPIPLGEDTVAEQRFDPGPLVFCGYARAEVKMGCMTTRALKRVLVKDSISPEYGTALDGAFPAMFVLLCSNTFDNKVDPLILRETCKGARPNNWYGNGFRHATVIPEEMLGPGGREDFA
jgi:hypothetical protein